MLSGHAAKLLLYRWQINHNYTYLSNANDPFFDSASLFCSVCHPMASKNVGLIESGYGHCYFTQIIKFFSGGNEVRFTFLLA